MSSLTRRALLAAAASLPAALRASPAGEAWRIAADFEPMRAIWLAHHPAHEAITFELMRLLAPHVPLRLLVRDAERQEAVEAKLALQVPAGLNLHWLIDPLPMFFLRDAAVFARASGGGLGVVDFRWSDYGLPSWCARRHAGDAQRRADCATPRAASLENHGERIARLAGARLLPQALSLEGGGVEVNGRGLMIACEALLTTRNPGWSRSRLETALLQLPGVRRLIWLPEGLAQDVHLRGTIAGDHVGWGTGGHTDEFVRFADERTVLLAWQDGDDRHPVSRLNRVRMQRNAVILERGRDLQGRPLRVLRVPLPRVLEREVLLAADADTTRSEQWTADHFRPEEGRRNGQRVMQVATASPLNFVVANGVVVVPGFESQSAAWHERVRRLFEQAFPGRVVRFIDATGWHWVGAGPHCATLSEPA